MEYLPRRKMYVHHFVTAKHSVYNTLAHRAKIVSSNQESLHKELNHIRKALQACHFPPMGTQPTTTQIQMQEQQQPGT